MNKDWPIQIDPEGCGCTECLIGEYIPLDQADGLEILCVLSGLKSNGTDMNNDDLYDRWCELNTYNWLDWTFSGH